MKVLKNYFYNALYQLFKVIVPFITIPYLSHVLGPKGIGINSYTNSIIQIFILVGDLGITTYGNRKIAYVRNNRYKLTQTFYEIMILQICTLSVAYSTFIIFLMFTDQYRPYYLAQSILIFAYALDISWFFMGIENFRITVLRNFIVRILIVFCIFVFVKSYSNLILYILLYGTSFLIGNLTLFSSLRRYIGLPNLSHLHIWQHLMPSIALFIPNVASQVYQILNKAMLGFIKGATDTGFYDQSDKVVKMVLAVVTATGTVMLPHVAHAFANGRKKATKQYLCDSFSFVTALSVAMAFGIAAITPTFVPMFFGRKFMIVIPLMMIEAIIIIIIAWSNVIGIQYLLPTKQTKQYTISVISGSIMNIIINIPMILLFGVIGTTVSTVFSELAVTCYQLYVIRNQISFKKMFNDWYKYLLSGVIMFGIVIWMNITFPMTWIMMLIEIFVGIIIYMLIIFVMKANVFNVIKKMLSTNY